MMTKQALWEARWIFAVLGIIWAIDIAICCFLPIHLRWLVVPCSVLPAALILFTFYFFRDPERTPPADPTLAVSPADGVVVEISETTDERGEAVKRVGIFLSVFNVHINRSPIAGIVRCPKKKSANISTRAIR